jgi:hypothetical protein
MTCLHCKWLTILFSTPLTPLSAAHRCARRIASVESKERNAQLRGNAYAVMQSGGDQEERIRKQLRRCRVSGGVVMPSSPSASELSSQRVQERAIGRAARRIECWACMGPALWGCQRASLRPQVRATRVKNRRVPLPACITLRFLALTGRLGPIFFLLPGIQQAPPTIFSQKLQMRPTRGPAAARQPATGAGPRHLATGRVTSPRKVACAQNVVWARILRFVIQRHASPPGRCSAVPTRSPPTGVARP